MRRAKVALDVHRSWRRSTGVQHLRQKPSLGFTRLRRSWQWRRALAAFQANRRMRYAMTSAALRLTPAPQCTSTAATAAPA